MLIYVPISQNCPFWQIGLNLVGTTVQSHLLEVGSWRRSFCVASEECRYGRSKIQESVLVTVGVVKVAVGTFQPRALLSSIRHFEEGAVLEFRW